MGVTATEARNRLGSVPEEAQRAPVFIEKAGRQHSVILSNERYDALVPAGAGPSSRARARRFADPHADWLAEQNLRLASAASWHEAFRRW